MIIRTRHVVWSKMINIYIYICLRFYSVKTVDAFHDQYICLVFSLKNGEDHGKIMGIIVNVDGKKSPPWSRSSPAAQEPFGSPRTAVQTGSFVLYKRNGTTTAVWTQHSQIFSDILRYSQIFSAFFLCFLFWFDVFVASLKRFTLCSQTPTTAKL